MTIKRRTVIGAAAAVAATPVYRARAQAKTGHKDRRDERPVRPHIAT